MMSVLAAAVSTSMLKSVGVDYVVAGHSERRAVFGDSDEDVNKKVRERAVPGCLPSMLGSRSCSK